MLVSKGLLDVKRGSGTRVRRRANWALLDDDVLAWHLSVEPKPAFFAATPRHTPHEGAKSSCLGG